jgi:hypothetical protein
MPHVDDVEAWALKAAGNIFRWRVWVKMTEYCVYRLYGILEDVEIVEISLLQIGFHGCFRHFFCYNTGSFSFISELVLPFDVVL